jgi:hypothetical protein
VPLQVVANWYIPSVKVFTLKKMVVSSHCLGAPGITFTGRGRKIGGGARDTQVGSRMSVSDGLAIVVVAHSILKHSAAMIELADLREIMLWTIVRVGNAAERSIG